MHNPLELKYRMKMKLTERADENFTTDSQHDITLLIIEYVLDEVEAKGTWEEYQEAVDDHLKSYDAVLEKMQEVIER